MNKKQFITFWRTLFGEQLTEVQARDKVWGQIELVREEGEWQVEQAIKRCNRWCQEEKDQAYQRGIKEGRKQIKEEENKKIERMLEDMYKTYCKEKLTKNKI